MTTRIFLKLIGAILCLLIVVVTAVDFLASRVAESNHIQTLTRDLAERGRLLASLSGNDFARLSEERVHALARSAGARLTVIAPDGLVIADSEARAEQMENHRQRPEFREALNGKQGSSIRQSPTMGVKFLYVAVPLPSGALRLAVPLSAVQRQVNSIRKEMAASAALAFVPAVVLAAFFARRVSAKLAGIIEHAGKLAEGNFQARLDSSGVHELGLLARKLNETGGKLQAMFEELQRERAELEKLERIRKDFVINVSHELRTPLASIQGYTETLLEGALYDSENNVRFLSIILQNAERLARLTADLLTLSRIEMKTQPFRFASYPVNAILAESADSMRPIAEKKIITITIEPAPDGTEVFCDSEAVHQVLGNLLDNALKYTPEGGAITAGIRPAAKAPQNQAEVEIYVRDTGIGIPAEDLPRLFERFYRVDKARSRELGGTGLGLAIVKHLVRTQGGEVRVESEMNRGSTFYFTLPAQEPAPVPSAQLTAS